MSKEECDWIFCYGVDHPELPYGIFCARCGAKEQPALPIRLNEYIQAIEVFGLRHKDCVPPKEATNG